MLKVQTRNGVFETNSSSSHSVTIDKNEIVIIDLPKETLREGVLRVELSSKDYGWEWGRFRRPENKIAYLLIQYAGGCLPADAEGLRAIDDHAEIFRDDVRCSWFLSTIEKATGCRIEITRQTDDTTWGYAVDHQSTGVGIDGIEDEKDILLLVFGKNSFIETGNDNESPPEIIVNDLDVKEQYYESLLVQSVPDGDRFRLQEIKGKGGAVQVGYVSGGDHLHTPDVHWSFLEELRGLLRQGDVVVEGFDVTMPCPDGLEDGVFEDFARKTAFKSWVGLFNDPTNLKILQDFVVTCRRKDYAYEMGERQGYVHDWYYEQQAEISISIVARDDTARKVKELVTRAHDHEFLEWKAAP